LSEMPLYAASTWQVSALHEYVRPFARVTSISQAASNELFVTFADSMPGPWVFCAELQYTPTTVAGTAASVPGKLSVAHPVSPSKRISSLLIPFQQRLTKDSTAYVSLREVVRNDEAAAKDACVSRENWATIAIRTPSEPATDTAAPKVIKLKAIDGSLETDAVVVRLDYEGATKDVEVWINGAKATIRNRVHPEKNGAVTGGSLYASVAQQLKRATDPDRRIRVEVHAKGFEPASAEVRASW
jgi:hypothetical protein